MHARASADVQAYEGFQTSGRAADDGRSDEALVANWHRGNPQAGMELVDRYTALAERTALRFRADDVDVRALGQAGVVGVFDALYAFDFEDEESFRDVVGRCIERQVEAAASRQLHLRDRVAVAD